MNRLVVASTNAGKIREVAAALAPLAAWRVVPLRSDAESIDETGTTFLANAELKAAHYSRLDAEAWTLADDSGFSVDGLDGRPGVESARYAPTPEARNARLLVELEAAGPAASRRARFHCAFAVARRGAIVWKTEAVIDGRIPERPAGTGGFGYDPIFWIPECGKTLAELPLEGKNRWSARGLALVELRQYLGSIKS